MSRNLRIIAGKFKKHTIATPDGGTTHPMGDRERLALFNMIAIYLADTVVLDAYAGSGALGLEALSRGAQKAIFVDSDHRATTVIRQNITKLGLEEQTEVKEQKIENFTPDGNFGVVFVDPPYNIYGPGVIWTIIRNLLPAIKEDGILVLSHPPSDVPLQFDGFAHLTSRKYAGAVISIFQRQKA